jgi:hypothetical protein
MLSVFPWVTTKTLFEISGNTPVPAKDNCEELASRIINRAENNEANLFNMFSPNLRLIGISKGRAECLNTLNLIQFTYSNWGKADCAPIIKYSNCFFQKSVLKISEVEIINYFKAQEYAEQM